MLNLESVKLSCIMCISFWTNDSNKPLKTIILTLNTPFSFFVMWLGSENLIFRKELKCILSPVTWPFFRSISLVPVPDHLPFYLATINYVIKTDLKLNSLLFHLIIHAFMLLSKRNKRFLLTLSCCIRFASTQIGAVARRTPYSFQPCVNGRKPACSTDCPIRDGYGWIRKIPCSDWVA